MQTLIRLFCLSLALLCSVAAYAANTTTAKYDRMYVFGDSFADIGLRFVASNDSAVPWYFAKKIGIDLTYPGAPKSGSKSLDFGASGATTGVDDGNDRWCCHGISKQVSIFADMVRKKEIQFNPDTTLFMIEGGLNDDDLSAKQSIHNISEQVSVLRKVGARHITLTLLPTQIPEFSVVALRINPELEKLVRQESHGGDLVLNHWGPILDQIKQNPERYGLTNTVSKCAGTKVFEEEPSVCANPDKYFFYFTRHPSAVVNKIVADRLVEELVVKGH